MLILLSTSFQSLEAEMKKLQNSIQESTQNFDEHLKRLFERRVKAEMVVNQVSKSFTHRTFSFKESLRGLSLFLGKRPTPLLALWSCSCRPGSCSNLTSATLPLTAVLPSPVPWAHLSAPSSQLCLLAHIYSAVSPSLQASSSDSARASEYMLCSFTF